MADSAAQKKPGFIDRVKRFFRDIKGEVKKIVWPSKKQVINNTVIVVIHGRDLRDRRRLLRHRRNPADPSLYQPARMTAVRMLVLK